MKVALRKIQGPWDAGWVLDKHSVSSVCVGYDAYNHPRFETVRTEVGEATFQLKYRFQFDLAEPLAKALATQIYPRLNNVGLIVPMPASTKRSLQPVTAVADALGVAVKKPVFHELLLKTPNGQSLKNLHTKAEKEAAIADSFYVQDEIAGDGAWNVLVVDDLFHTGASIEAACKALRTYPKIRNIYMAALTWR